MKKITFLLLIMITMSNAQQIKVTSGTIKRFSNFESKFVAARNIDVWLPDGYSDKEKLVFKLAPIVAEEWGHFRLVLNELKKRKLKLGKQRKDAYVNKLIEFQKKGGSPEDRLLDHLLTMALIEARSCERFKRLSEGLPDEYMRNFYRRFMESEAGHYTLFIDLAETYLEKKKVRNRWNEWLVYESTVMGELEVRGDRIH